MIKVLHLPLKAQWFDMIESGEKKEEYREIRDYWAKRLIWWHGYNGDDDPVYWDECLWMLRNGQHEEVLKDEVSEFAHFSHACFRYGYTKRTMMFNIENISIGKGKPEWGAPDYPVFIIKLGERIE